MVRNRASTPLSKAKVRQSWSKYNLYNLSRVRDPPTRTRTFFQQKWAAKSILRAYHGEQVREGQWSRMFQRRAKSVVPIDAEYLARNDGSIESAGRGAGLTMNGRRFVVKKTPYMQMTFAPLERRLDSAIFRSLFASSARQARQFVVHGAVKVNGKKMRYPGYLLNPGDMFQVDVERVMFATGAMKHGTEVAKDETDGEEKEGDLKAAAPATEEIEEFDIDRDPRDVLKDLLSRTKTILSAPRDKLAAKRKQELRAFSQAVKRMLSRSQSSTVHTDSLEAQFLELQNQLKIQRQSKKQSLPSEQKPKAENAENQELSMVTDSVKAKDETVAEELTALEEAVSEQADTIESSTSSISDSDYNDLHAALMEMQENPVDESKPYATPWTPRDYMSAFAFIPRYLEVNQNICAAVYLRHPVARPGMSEVPSPFAEDTAASAYAWYLRRR